MKAAYRPPSAPRTATPLDRRAASASVARTQVDPESLKPHMVMPTLRAQRLRAQSQPEDAMANPQAQKELDRELAQVRHRHEKRKANPLVRQSAGSVAASSRGSGVSQRRGMAAQIKVMEEEARQLAMDTEDTGVTTVRQARLPAAANTKKRRVSAVAPGAAVVTAGGDADGAESMVASSHRLAHESAAPMHSRDRRDEVASARRRRMGRSGKGHMTAIQRMRDRPTAEDKERERRINRLREQNAAKHNHMRGLTMDPESVATLDVGGGSGFGPKPKSSLPTWGRVPGTGGSSDDTAALNDLASVATDGTEDPFAAITA